MQELIALDDLQRMVPVDRPALVREVDRLLAEPVTVRTRRQAGVGLVALGEYDRAVTVLTEALALAEQAGDTGGRIAARINLGERGAHPVDRAGATVRAGASALVTAARTAAGHCCFVSKVGRMMARPRVWKARLNPT